jgi:hypothetical protein
MPVLAGAAQQQPTSIVVKGKSKGYVDAVVYKAASKPQSNFGHFRGQGCLPAAEAVQVGGLATTDEGTRRETQTSRSCDIAAAGR